MGIRCNMGSADRIVRAIIGLSLLGFALFGLFPGAWRVVLPLIGLVLVVTAAVGYCPAYQLLRLDGSRR